MARNPLPFYIQDVRKVKALASPVRAAIIDVLEVLGAATVVQAADSLGYPPDGLYYHFALLERNGLVIRAEPEKGTDAARFQLPGHPATLRYRLDDPRQQAATAKVVATMVRSAERSFRRAFAPGLATVDGPRRVLVHKEPADETSCPRTDPPVALVRRGEPACVRRPGANRAGKDPLRACDAPHHGEGQGQ